MTQEERNIILNLRKEGFGYKVIASKLNLPVSSVSTFCKRYQIAQNTKIQLCKNCGIQLIQTKGHRQKIFCSDKCRRIWWKHHPEAHNLKCFSPCTCNYCKKTFKVYSNKTRKYCSFDCYLKSKQGGAFDE